MAKGFLIILGLGFFVFCLLAAIGMISEKPQGEVARIIFSGCLGIGMGTGLVLFLIVSGLMNWFINKL